MNKSFTVIDIGTDFTRYPAGRFTGDGPFSGEAFREKFLIPILKESGRATVKLDGTVGYGSSFLEEAFGGLVRAGYATESVLAAFVFDTKDTSLKDEIIDYIKHAVQPN